jgi:hypothetical protein
MVNGALSGQMIAIIVWRHGSPADAHTLREVRAR